MKKIISSSGYIITMGTIFFFGYACNRPVKKDAIKANEHAKLIKTIGNPRYGNVQCGLQDKAGNLWFGTTENGLYKYDGKSFSQFLVADGLNSNNVYCILEDKENKIWIGTEAGLCMYNGKTFKTIKIPLPPNMPSNKNPYYQKHWVYSMLQAKNGEIWFVTIDGVYIYDGKQFTQFIIDENANGFLSANDKVERILEDAAGNIWFGGRTNEGVYRYNGKTITHFNLKELFQNGPKPKTHKWAWPQVQDKNGHIWFSNWGGAYCYDGKNFTSFTSQDGLSGDMVARIIEDKKGNIWLGGAGLSRYNGKTFTRFTTKDGLPDVGIWEILEDNTENIWIGTRETGLYLYNGKRFITYSEFKQSPTKY
jgi:ligand-binding sensor domain-containing protein